MHFGRGAPDTSNSCRQSQPGHHGGFSSSPFGTGSTSSFGPWGGYSCGFHSLFTWLGVQKESGGALTLWWASGSTLQCTSGIRWWLQPAQGTKSCTATTFCSCVLLDSKNGTGRVDQRIPYAGCRCRRLMGCPCWLCLLGHVSWQQSSWDSHWLIKTFTAQLLYQNVATRLPICLILGPPPSSLVNEKFLGQPLRSVLMVEQEYVFRRRSRSSSGKIDRWEVVVIKDVMILRSRLLNPGVCVCGSNPGRGVILLGKEFTTNLQPQALWRWTR